MTASSFAPRINHVAISVDADIMDEPGRAALLDFFSDVFGWVEGDNSTEQGNPLILYTGSIGQFLPAISHIDAVSLQSKQHGRGVLNIDVQIRQHLGQPRRQVAELVIV